MRIRTTIARTAVAVTLLAVAACGGGSDDDPQASVPTKRYYDQYVALGDSYTAAPLVGTVSIDDVCIRSGINYPSLVARSLGSSRIDRSCSSADLSNLHEVQKVEGTKVPPQLEAVTPRTDLVTIGMGGNPAATMAWFATCPQLAASDPEGSPCREHYNSEGSDEVIEVLRSERKQMVAALKAIKKRAPEARVLVIGYPAIFPEKGACPDRLPLAKGDVQYAGEVLQYLNDKVLRHAAEKTGSEFVDVYAATKGHDICAEDPWIQGKKDEVGVALAFHPRAEEQRAVATLIQRHLR